MEIIIEETLLNRNKSNSQTQSFNIIRFTGDLLSFMLPCFMYKEVSLGGRLFVPEVVLLCLLPILLYFRAKWLLKPMVTKIIIFALLWLCAQIVTDFIRTTPFEDWSRGWAKIIFFQLNFIALYLFLSKRQIRMILFSLGLAAGQLITFFLSPSEYAIESPWKFGVGYPITLLLVLLSLTAAIKKINYGTEIVIGLAAVLNLMLGTRSLALVCVATMVFVLVNKQSNKQQSANTITKLTLIKLIMLFVGVGIITSEGYKYAALNGWLSQKETEKYIQQSKGKLGLLLSGRTEFLAASSAIYDSPVIGHGSWAKNPKYMLTTAYLLSELEYENPEMYIAKDDLIPSHSYLFGAWVEAGIVGAVFWGWVWMLVFKTLCALYHAKEELLPLAAFICFNMLWDILFSPFGAAVRMYEAYHLVLIVFVVSRAIQQAQSGILRPT